MVVATELLTFRKTLADDDLEPAAKDIHGILEKEISAYFAGRGVSDVAVSVQLETGSTRVKVVVVAVVAVLIEYGDIRQGVETLVHDAKWVSQVVVRTAPAILGMSNEPPQSKRLSTGIPGRLRRLFEQVERGEITAEEAVRRAKGIIREAADGSSIPQLEEITQRLERELLEVARNSTDEQRRRPLNPAPPFALEPDRPRRRRKKRAETSESTYDGEEPPRPQFRRRGVIVERDPTSRKLKVAHY